MEEPMFKILWKGLNPEKDKVVHLNSNKGGFHQAIAVLHKLCYNKDIHFILDKTTLKLGLLFLDSLCTF